MNKKAVEISPPSLVVIIILVLLVLVILIYIFGSQSGEFLRIINQWRGEITSEENQCESAILGRYCEPDCGEGYTSRRLPNPPGGEWDCGECWECVPE